MRISKGSSADEKYVRPMRAVKKWKMAQGMRQTVYLYGMTGSGKTAFVREMLRSKSYDCYSAAETDAEQIELPTDDRFHIIVLEDLHELCLEQKREAYAKRMAALLACKKVWLILISRCRIPHWLMSLHVEHVFLTISEEDLRLNLSGQEEYFARWNLQVSAKQSEQIFETKGGNPLFLRFFVLAEGDEKQAMSDLWRYMSCIYDQWDAQLQEFLLEMSVVERFDMRMAQLATGRSDVPSLMRRAMETGNFLIEKDGMYQLHSLLRQSVTEYLERKVDVKRLGRIYYNAGRMYELYGDIANALKMYEAGGDEESILRLLVENARQNPAGRHYFELRRYYLLLSEESVLSSPVLMAGMSMLWSMMLNEEESERWYRLLEQFAAQSRGSARREAKNRLLYLDIGLPHRGTVQVLDLLKHAGMLLRDGKAVLPEFSVTSNLPSLMNGGKDFCSWSKRDRQLAERVGGLVEFVLGKYGRGLVSIALAESFFEKGEDSYEIVSLAEKGRMQAEAGGKIEQVFVAVGILVWLSVLNGHADDAREILDGFGQKAEREAPQLLLNLSAFRCRMELYQGKTPRIQQWMEQAPDENEDFCSLERFRYLTKIRCYLLFARYDKAYGLLQRMLYYAKKHKRDYIAMECLLLLAVTKYRVGEEGWQSLLQECITRAEEYHFVRIFSREGGAVLKLLKAGQFSWQEESFRRQVLKECEKMEQYYPSYLKEKAKGEIVLSDHALSILRLQAEGYRTNEIAKLLDLSCNTIKYHNKETYRKLHVSSKAAAVSEAKNRGLI